MQSHHETAVSVVRKLQGKERIRFLQTLARHRVYRAAMEDLVDGLLIEERRGEPGRPLAEYLAGHRRRRR